MKNIYKHYLTPNAKKLRKDMTKEERHLWYDFLSGSPVKFTRQKIIGNYIVDFYCSKAKLIIELDGSQHYEKEGKVSDMQRDGYMQSLGITVLRYSNLDVTQNFDGVCEDISRRVEELTGCGIL
jgi:very-short-patch-repair endonuclease